MSNGEPGVNWTLKAQDTTFQAYYVRYGSDERGVSDDVHFGLSPSAGVTIPAEEVGTVKLEPALYDALVNAAHQEDDWPTQISADVEYGNTPRLRLVTEDEAITFKPKTT